jgi:hypothetical protein
MVSPRRRFNFEVMLAGGMERETEVLLEVYQRPDDTTMRNALQRRTRLSVGALSC